MPLKFSATSVFLPHLDLNQTCQLLKDNGADGLELRVRYYEGDPDAAPSSWGRHVTDISPDNVTDRADEIKQTLAKHGIALAAFASSVRANDLETIRKLAEGAAATGCPQMRIAAVRNYDREVGYATLFEESLAAYEKALGITRPYGVRVIIETHLRSLFVSASLAYRLVSRFDPADIGVLYDPQNMVMDGYETTPMALDLLGDYLAHLHVGGHACTAGEPDENGTVTWTYPSCPMGEGLYNYPELLDELRRRNYGGFVSIEDFDRTRTPERRLADAMEYLRKIDPSRS